MARVDQKPCAMTSSYQQTINNNEVYVRKKIKTTQDSQSG